MLQAKCTPPPAPSPPAPAPPELLHHPGSVFKSEIMDGFLSSWCLNDHIDLPDKMGSFSSGATTPMVVKKGIKKTFHTQNKYKDKIITSGQYFEFKVSKRPYRRAQ